MDRSGGANTDGGGGISRNWRRSKLRAFISAARRSNSALSTVNSPIHQRIGPSNNTRIVDEKASGPAVDGIVVGDCIKAQQISTICNKAWANHCAVSN